MGNFRCNISFYAIGHPYVVKVWVYYQTGFPYVGKHMGTNTTLCTIGFPEVKIALSWFPMYGPHMAHRYIIGFLYVVIFLGLFAGYYCM